MDISQFNPLIRYIDKRCNLNSYFNSVVAFDHRFFYVSKGEIHIVLNDKKFILKVNEALIVPPGVQYKVYSHNNDNVLYIVNFDYIYDIKNEDISGIPPVSPESFEKSNVICDKTCDAFPMKLICCEDAAGKLENMLELYRDKPMLYRQCMSVIFKESAITKEST